MGFPLQVIKTNGSLSGLGSDLFTATGGQSPLALAYIDPRLDFQDITTRLAAIAGQTPVVALSTAGELCSVAQNDPLYLPSQGDEQAVIVQIFPHDLLADVSIHAIPLHNEDIRRGSFTGTPEARVNNITRELKSVKPRFAIDAHDTVALTFIDGLSSCENYFMEAVYRSQAFPCMFVGGSAGGKLDFLKTMIFAGGRVLEDYAVIVLLKMGKGRGYSIFKTQNFVKTAVSFDVAEADSDRRVVGKVFDDRSGEKRSFVQAVADILAVDVSHLHEQFKKKTFAIEIDGELFIRSVSGVNTQNGTISFYCDINPGDRLHLVETTDFVEQSRHDIKKFLAERPQPLGAILNDCILRRLNNSELLDGIQSPWPMPVAGFSTFGELYGINVNQTLTALVFFDLDESSTVDPLIAQFPNQYARFYSYFVLRKEMARRNLAETGNKILRPVREVDGVVYGLRDCFITINQKGVILSCNNGAIILFGYSEAELLGNNVSMLMPEPYAAAHDGYLARYVATDEARILETGREVTGKRKNGDLFPMHLSVSKIVENDEVRFVGVCRDITEQKKREEQLNSDKQSADKASQAKSKFLANMSHELRTPLNGIMGMTRLLLESDLRVDQKELASNVFQASNVLLEIVNDILDISKIEANGLDLEYIGVDIKDIARGVVRTLQALADYKALKLTLHVDDQIPFLLADPTRVRQILTNLIGNAIKYTESGGVTASLVCLRKKDSLVTLRAEVTDTGIGIDEDKIERIFDSFTQADNSITRKFGGTGLGLAIAKKLVELMGGKIGVNSKLGQGSTFWFEIDFSVADSLYEARFNRVENSGQGHIPANEARILAAEDIKMNAMLVKKILNRIGVSNVTIVENGALAIQAYQAEKWDLLLLDCFMPEMTGYDVATKIREFENASGEHIPIVAMTANAMVGDREKCLRAGMDDYIAKPLNFETVTKVLSQWIKFEPRD